MMILFSQGLALSSDTVAVLQPEDAKPESLTDRTPPVREKNIATETEPGHRALTVDQTPASPMSPELTFSLHGRPAGPNLVIQNIGETQSSMSETPPPQAADSEPEALAQPETVTLFLRDSESVETQSGDSTKMSAESESDPSASGTTSTTLTTITSSTIITQATSLDVDESGSDFERTDDKNFRIYSSVSESMPGPTQAPASLTERGAVTASSASDERGGHPHRDGPSSSKSAIVSITSDSSISGSSNPAPSLSTTSSSQSESRNVFATDSEVEVPKQSESELQELVACGLTDGEARKLLQDVRTHAFPFLAGADCSRLENMRLPPAEEQGPKVARLIDITPGPEPSSKTSTNLRSVLVHLIKFYSEGNCFKCRFVFFAL
jgi:hypothetical protein